MRERLPSPKDIDELVAFLPQLYGEQRAPLVRWHEGKEAEPGVLTMPWLEYSPVVEEFVKAASKKCWQDYEYVEKDVNSLLADKTFISRASIREIRTILTFCIRGERFCTGHLEGVIEDGTIRALLERLEELR